MQRYWSSLRYSFLRTLFLLAADLRRHPTDIVHTVRFNGVARVNLRLTRARVYSLGLTQGARASLGVTRTQHNGLTLTG